MTQQFTNNSSSDGCVDARQHLSLELLVNALGAVTDGPLFVCERFWQDGDPNTCVVDRALENGLKLEFGM